MSRGGKFIAVANMKGGVGKTTTVVSLAEALAADDLDGAVLVVDLDPQGSASLCLAGDEVLAEMIRGGRTLQDFIEMRLFEKRKETLPGFIRGHYSYTTHRGRQLNLALLPCGPRLRLLERQIIYEYTRQGHSMNAIEGTLRTLFRGHFEPLRAHFDYVLFDCPPGISPFAETAIRASDMVIVPTIPDEISNFGLNAFCASLWDRSASSAAVPPKPHVLATRVQGLVRQHQDMLERFALEAAAADADYHLLRARIPQAAALASALVSGAQKTFTQKYGPAVPVLDGLVREIKEVCHGDRH